MPILDVDVVGPPSGGAPLDGAAEGIAAAAGRALAIPEGQLWVTVRQHPASRYAENGPPGSTLPVFVRVLARDRTVDDRSRWAATIADVVAEFVARDRTAVHVIFEPDATGRVYFGGAPDPRRH